MTKKDKELKGGLNALLGNSTVNSTTESNSNQGGDSMKEYGRLCAIVNTRKMNKLRQIASVEGLSIKAVLEAAMDLAIEAYESKHGEVVIPSKSDNGDAHTNVFK